jgi:hypothetical protein
MSACAAGGDGESGGGMAQDVPVECVCRDAMCRRRRGCGAWLNLHSRSTIADAH